MLWTEANIGLIINQREYNLSETLAGKSDVLRYEVIHRYGGVYLDVDVVCLKPLDELVENLEQFTGYYDSADTVLCNAVIGCSKWNMHVKRLITAIPRSFRDYTNPQDRCGPWFLDRMLRDDEEFTKLSHDLIFPYSYTEEFKGYDAYPKAFLVHHWEGSWCEK